MLSPPYVIVTVALLLLFLPFVQLQIDQCSADMRKRFDQGDSSKVYLELEKALLEQNHDILGQIRVRFLNYFIEKIEFALNITVHPTCYCDPDDCFFPPEEFLEHILSFTYFSPLSTAIKSSTDNFVLWSTLVHGSLSVYRLIATYDYFHPDYNGIPITLYIDKLPCVSLSTEENLREILVCNSDNLFSWVSIKYSERYAIIIHVYGLLILL